MKGIELRKYVIIALFFILYSLCLYLCFTFFRTALSFPFVPTIYWVESLVCYVARIQYLRSGQRSWSSTSVEKVYTLSWEARFFDTIALIVFLHTKGSCAIVGDKNPWKFKVYGVTHVHNLKRIPPATRNDPCCKCLLRHTRKHCFLKPFLSRTDDLK